MILLGRRPDYYDYLVGIYGRDEKKVFNRKKDIISDEIYFDEHVRWRNYNIYDLYVCNRIYRVEQIAKGKWELHKFHKVNTDYMGMRRHYRESQVSGLDDFEYYIPRPPEMLTDSPIEIRSTFYKKDSLEGFTPILSTFGIPPVLSAEELYSEVDMYLGARMAIKEQESHRDDKNKLLAKGFDKKLSFRHRK